MDLPAANLLASMLTYAVAITIGIWYLAPALRRRPLADALTVLVWFHAFRHVAMQIFSAADVGGLDAPISAQRTIALGDITAAFLALITLWALRRPLAAARPLTWLVAIVGIADLISATVVGIDNKLSETASDWSWVILAFYVPFLWVTAVMLLWQLISRRSEPLGSRHSDETTPAR
jgi:hypothetical protein